MGSVKYFCHVSQSLKRSCSLTPRVGGGVLFWKGLTAGGCKRQWGGKSRCSLVTEGIGGRMCNNSSHLNISELLLPLCFCLVMH